MSGLVSFFDNEEPKASDLDSWLSDSSESFELPDHPDTRFMDTCPIRHIFSEDPSNLALHTNMVEGIRGIFDPEISVNIYDLGLIYGLNTADPKKVVVHMTLTSVNCPEAESLPKRVFDWVQYVYDDREVKIVLVWTPSWGMHRVSEEVRLQMGMMY